MRCNVKQTRCKAGLQSHDVLVTGMCSCVDMAFCHCGPLGTSATRYTAGVRLCWHRFHRRETRANSAWRIQTLENIMRIQQTLAAAALVLAGNPVPAKSGAGAAAGQKNRWWQSAPSCRPHAAGQSWRQRFRRRRRAVYRHQCACDPAAAGYCQSGTDRRDDRAGRGEEVPMPRLRRSIPPTTSRCCGWKASRCPPCSSAIRIRWSKARRWQ